MTKQAEANYSNQKKKKKTTEPVILKQCSTLGLENTLSQEMSTNSKSLDSGYET